jgi:hypothetical protein
VIDLSTAWTQSRPSFCPALTFAWKDEGTTNAPDSSIFTLESGNTIKIFTNDAVKVGFYNLKVTTTMAPYP